MQLTNPNSNNLNTLKELTRFGGISSTIIKVVHSWHFWAIFGSFLIVWLKNDQNGPKNELKNDAKNGHIQTPPQTT